MTVRGRKRAGRKKAVTVGGVRFRLKRARREQKTEGFQAIQ